MTTVLTLILLATSVSSPSAPIPDNAPRAQTEDRVVVVGAGAAFDLNPPVAVGGAAFVEYEAVDGILELELGGQLVGTQDGRELSLDLIGKWPHRLTGNLELMIGVGPTIVAVRGARPSTAWGIQGALDIMWWPTHRVGFWVEPTYEVLFRRGLTGAFGCTLGPMVGW